MSFCGDRHCAAALQAIDRAVQKSHTFISMYPWGFWTLHVQLPFRQQKCDPAVGGVDVSSASCIVLICAYRIEFMPHEHIKNWRPGCRASKKRAHLWHSHLGQECLHVLAHIGVRILQHHDNAAS